MAQNSTWKLLPENLASKMVLVWGSDGVTDGSRGVWGLTTTECRHASMRLKLTKDAHIKA